MRTRTASLGIALGITLLCTTLQSHAQLSDASFSFFGTLPNQYFWDPKAEDYVGGPNESFEAKGGLDLLPYDASGLGGGIGFGGDPFNATAYADVVADVSFDPDGSQTYSVWHRAVQGHIDNPPSVSVLNSGASVVFSICEAGAEAELVISKFNFDGTDGQVSFEFSGPQGTILEINDTDYPYTNPLPAVIGGPLDPGDYTLSSTAHQGEIGYSLTITPAPGCTSPPACVGDLTNDNEVDSDDLAVLLGAFGTSPEGDLNSDGVTDSDDLALLLGAFGSTCD